MSRKDSSSARTLHRILPQAFSNKKKDKKKKDKKKKNKKESNRQPLRNKGDTKRLNNQPQFVLGSFLVLFRWNAEIVITIISVRKNSKGKTQKNTTYSKRAGSIFSHFRGRGQGRRLPHFPYKILPHQKKKKPKDDFFPLASNWGSMYSHRVTHTDASHLLGTSQGDSTNSINSPFFESVFSEEN